MVKPLFKLYFLILLVFFAISCEIKVEKKNIVTGDVIVNPETSSNGDATEKEICPDPSLCPSLGVCKGYQIAKCVNGKTVCDFSVIKENYEDKETLCDGLDNDCNGIVDVDIEDTSKANCLNKGVCAKNKDKIAAMCVNGSWVCDYSAVPDYEISETKCDGKDNDCDGKVDNNIPMFFSDCSLEGVCSKLDPTQIKCEDGKWVCPYSEIPEYEEEETTCDGLDNDCDGETDEGLEEVDGDKGGCKTKGVCSKVTASCVDGKWVCNYDKLKYYEEGSEKSCDAKDNDCDGATDEDLINVPVSSGLTTCNTKGVCSKLTTATCVDGLWACGYDKIPEYEQLNETKCDGLDNDCDGETDEGLDEVPVENTTCSFKGVCIEIKNVKCDTTKGEWDCNPQDYADILQESGFQTFETLCDGLDNDCDGQTDEDLIDFDGTLSGCSTKGVCKDHLIAVCDKETHEWVCNYTSPDYQEIETRCDGLDNDCDGETDEELVGTAEDYCSFLGVCSSVDPKDVNILCEDGKVKCIYPQTLETYEKEETTCDGLDNDCDGLTDENFSANPEDVCEFQGVCSEVDPAEVTVLCENGKIVCKMPDSVEGFEPVEKSCDGLDNDCDGETDEDIYIEDVDFCKSKGVCKTGVRAKCKFDEENHYVCDYSQVPNHEKTETLCDGLDNDCDGETDEGITDPEGTHCSNLGVCQGQSLFAVCKNGTWECNYDTIPSYEPEETLCDTLDNDCDGETDEGICGNPGSPCNDDGDCSLGLFCRKNLFDDNRFCSVDSTSCVYSYTPSKVFYANEGTKMCKSKYTLMECVSGEWQNQINCSDSTPVCYMGECLLCVPDEKGCINDTEIGLCSSAGDSFEKTGECPQDFFCYGQGFCISSKEFQVNFTTLSDQRTPKICRDGEGNFVITWASNLQDGSNYGIFAQKFYNTGIKKGSEFQVNENSFNLQQNPDIDFFTSDKFVVVWHSKHSSIEDDAGGIYGRVFSFSGDYTGSEFHINQITSGIQDNPKVAGNPKKGEYLVVWESENIEKNATNPLFGIAGRFFYENDDPKDQFVINTTVEDKQKSPDVTLLANGNYAVVWSSYGQDGDNFGIFAKVISPNGDTVAEEFQVNQITTGAQTYASICRVGSDRFVITWTGYKQGLNYAIFARVYKNDGTPQTDEFTVSTSPNVSKNSVCAGFEDGGFVVIWEESSFDFDGLGIAGRKYASDNTPETDPYQINIYTAADQKNTSVIATKDNLYIPVWQSQGEDGDGTGIFGRILKRK